MGTVSAPACGGVGMAMSVATYLGHFKQVKAYLETHSEASPELRSSFAGDAAAFKAAFSPEALKQALAGNAAVDVNLEDRITSTLLLLNRERARRTAG
jgi:hypothetical protein